MLAINSARAEFSSFYPRSPLIVPRLVGVIYLVTQLLLRNAMALQAPACYQKRAKLELVNPVRYQAGAW